jgi:hypothetical protein
MDVMVETCIDIEGQNINLKVLPWNAVYYPDPFKSVHGDELHKLETKINLKQAEILIEDLQHAVNQVKNKEEHHAKEEMDQG